MAKRTKNKELPEGKSEGNKFDKIFKENFEALATVLLVKFAGLEEGCEMKLMPKLKFQTTLEQEPDFVVMVKRKHWSNWEVLHIEFEAKDEKKTDKRMQLYFALLYDLFELEIDQHLIFLQEGKPKYFNGELRVSGNHHRYRIHCITDHSYTEFINSDKPEEVLLSVLANPEDKTGAEIIHLILERLIELKGNTPETMKFIQQLKIWSMLRKLRGETIKQVNKMKLIIPREFIEADELYLEGKEKGISEGMEKGISEGIEKGMEKGEEKGEEKKSIIAIRNMVKYKFSTSRIAGILDSPPNFVAAIRKQLLQAPSIITLLQEGKLNDAEIAKQLKVSLLLVEVIKKEIQ